MSRTEPAVTGGLDGRAGAGVGAALVVGLATPDVAEATVPGGPAIDGGAGLPAPAVHAARARSMPPTLTTCAARLTTRHTWARVR
ncbi:MAG TPA: hypothetical protein PLL54_00560 [Dermatophilaceae bacterium]|nr:hypothetical protein [Dermatophilaceae bacterium]